MRRKTDVPGTDGNHYHGMGPLVSRGRAEYDNIANFCIGRDGCVHAFHAVMVINRLVPGKMLMQVIAERNSPIA